MFGMFDTEELFSKSQEHVKEEKDLAQLKESEARYEQLEDKLMNNKKVPEKEFQKCVQDLMKDKAIMEAKMNQAKEKMIDMAEHMPTELLEIMMTQFVDDIIKTGIAVGERKSIVRLVGRKFGYLPAKD